MYVVLRTRQGALESLSIHAHVVCKTEEDAKLAVKDYNERCKWNTFHYESVETWDRRKLKCRTT